MTSRRRSTKTGRVRTVPWEQDPEIQARLQMVEAVWQQPLNRGLEIVNRRLEALGRPRVSYEQLKTDREHLRHILARRRDEVAEAMLRHLDNIELMKASVWRSINATPEGPARAPLYGMAERLERFEAVMDGSWGASREPVYEGPPVEVFGPSPSELLAAGKITDDQYRAYLTVMWQETGGRATTNKALAPPATPSPGASIEVVDVEPIESDASPPGEPGEPTSRPRLQPPSHRNGRGSNGNGNGHGNGRYPQHGLDRHDDSDDLYGDGEIVDWQPER